jgi:hypothetical protein
VFPRSIKPLLYNIDLDHHRFLEALSHNFITMTLTIVAVFNYEYTGNIIWEKSSFKRMQENEKKDFCSMTFFIFDILYLTILTGNNTHEGRQGAFREHIFSIVIIVKQRFIISILCKIP